MSEQVTTNIAESLASLTVPIDVPQLHPANYRKGNVEKIAESLARFGQVRPILVQKSSAYVIAGNHTLRAAQELGWTHIAVVVVDMDDEEAEGYLVADNRLSDLAENDEAVLAPILERMMLAGRLDGSGYSPDDVDDMLSRMDQIDVVEPEGEFKGDFGASDEEIQERFKNRSSGGALRQFVLLYDQATGTFVESVLVKLARKWGVAGARDVFLESLRRAAEAEGIEADAPEPTPGPEVDGEVPDPDDPQLTDEQLEAMKGRDESDAPLPPARDPSYEGSISGVATSERALTPLEAAGLVNPPSESTPPQPVTLQEQREQEGLQPAPFILYEDFPETNERKYTHPRCDGMKDGAIWVVPLDGMADHPAGATDECANCAQVHEVRKVIA